MEVNGRMAGMGKGGKRVNENEDEISFVGLFKYFI